MNFGISSGSVRNNEGGIFVQTKCTVCGGTNHAVEKYFKYKIKDKYKARVAGGLDRQQTGLPPCKCFTCRSVDHLISKFPKLLKDNEKRLITIGFNERGNCVTQKYSEDGDDYTNQNICIYDTYVWSWRKF